MSRNETTKDYDVVIVGASVAGCTAAIRFGRAGLRVALLERNRSADSYKALCGHFILGGAKSTLVELGLWDEMVAAGAATAHMSVHNGEDWIEPVTDGTVPEAISIRRQLLDPMLRRVAVATGGVDLLLGRTVTGVLEHGRRVTGVEATAVDGATERYSGRLVVGADGHRSKVAELAGVRTKAAPNGRFLYWAYYRGAPIHAPGGAQVWAGGRDVAVAVPTDDALTLFGVFAGKARLPEFEGDRAGALERAFAALPDAPDLAAAERASAVVGTSDYPFARRPPTPRPGLALIGDAATASDPVPAVGCAWAFRSAAWLADSTIPALTGHGRIDAGLRRYRRQHRMVSRYDALARRDAVALAPNPVQRVLIRAARHDRVTARRLGLFAMRAVPVTGVINPAVVLRAWRVARRHPSAAPATTPPPSVAVSEAG